MIKVHHNGCGARGGNDKIGKTRGGKNTKITICCDKDLNPIDIRINAGNESDMKIGREIAETIEAEEFVADKGYDSNFIRNILEVRNIKSTIPYRRNRKIIKEINTESYKERNKIERLFLKLKKFRRFTFRFEKRSENFLCITLIACICLFIGI